MRSRQLLVMAAAVGWAAMAAPPAEAQTQTIRLTTLAPRGSSYHRALQSLGETWQQISNGRVRLIIYPGGIQGGEPAMVERMAINQSQAAMLTADGLKAIEPAVAGLQLMPMMFRNFDEVDYIGEQLHPKLEQLMLDRGYVVLGWADAGWVRFFSRNPVVHPDDLRHQKLFTTAGSPETEQVYSAAGFNSVPLEPTDILTGLQTGLIDAVPIIPFYALATRLYGPAPYMLELNWAPLVGALVVKRQTWEAIPEAFRARMLDAAHQAADEIKTAGRREADAAVETMRTQWNLRVTPVPPGGEIEAEWRRAAEAAYPRIRGSMVPADIFDEVQRLLTEYRASHPGSRE